MTVFADDSEQACRLARRCLHRDEQVNPGRFFVRSTYKAGNDRNTVHQLLKLPLETKLKVNVHRATGFPNRRDLLCPQIVEPDGIYAVHRGG